MSGGSDSLCLAYFSKVYSSEFKNKIHVLIVDHKLRADSKNEAAKVKRILKSYDLSNYDCIYAYGNSRGDYEMLELATEKFYKPFR